MGIHRQRSVSSSFLCSELMEVRRTAHRRRRRNRTRRAQAGASLSQPSHRPPGAARGHCPGQDRSSLVVCFGKECSKQTQFWNRHFPRALTTGRVVLEPRSVLDEEKRRGASCFFLRFVIREWNDAHATKILSNVNARALDHVQTADCPNSCTAPPQRRRSSSWSRGS